MGKFNEKITAAHNSVNVAHNNDGFKTHRYGNPHRYGKISSTTHPDIVSLVGPLFAVYGREGGPAKRRPVHRTPSEVSYCMSAKPLLHT